MKCTQATISITAAKNMQALQKHLVQACNVGTTLTCQAHNGWADNCVDYCDAMSDGITYN